MPEAFFFLALAESERKARWQRPLRPASTSFETPVSSRCREYPAHHHPSVPPCSSGGRTCSIDRLRCSIRQILASRSSALTSLCTHSGWAGRPSHHSSFCHRRAAMPARTRTSPGTCRRTAQVNKWKKEMRSESRKLDRQILSAPPPRPCRSLPVSLSAPPPQPPRRALARTPCVPRVALQRFSARRRRSSGQSRRRRSGGTRRRAKRTRRRLCGRGRRSPGYTPARRR